MVDCEEGVFAIGERLSALFGCSWRLSKVDDCAMVPTGRGQELLNGFVQPVIRFRNAHMMTVGDNEALYLPRPISHTEYLEDHYGAPYLLEHGEDPDLSSIDDPEWVEEYRSAIESWQRHCRAASTGTAVAVHQPDPRRGKLVWIGDRAQEDTLIRAVVAQLLCNM